MIKIRFEALDIAKYSAHNWIMGVPGPQSPVEAAILAFCKAEKLTTQSRATYLGAKDKPSYERLVGPWRENDD